MSNLSEEQIEEEMFKKMLKNIIFNEIKSLPTSITIHWSFTLLLYCPYVIYDLPVAVLSARLQPIL